MLLSNLYTFIYLCWHNSDLTLFASVINNTNMFPAWVCTLGNTSQLLLEGGCQQVFPFGSLMFTELYNNMTESSIIVPGSTTSLGHVLYIRIWVQGLFQSLTACADLVSTEARDSI